MKRTLMRLLLFFTVSVGLFGCKKVNDWDIDPTHDRLFKPLIFEMSRVGATTVEIKYTRSVDANKYIFEFSKDSLQLTNVSKTVEVLADTLTPFAQSTSATRTEFRTIFEELDGSTGYSVRMKAVDTLSGRESVYSQFYFETGAEQLFTDYTSFTDKIQLSWKQTDRVTHIRVINPATRELVEDKTLSSAEKSTASAEIGGLNPGTVYFIYLYNGEVIRGFLSLKTTGLEGGVIINVNAGDDISQLIATAVTQGKSNITILFSSDQNYNAEVLTIPSGVGNLSFTGNPGPAGNLPVLNLGSVSLQGLIYGDVLFQNMEVKGNIGQYLFNAGTDNMKVGGFGFTGCKISSFRSIVRLANNTMDVKRVSFDDCIIDNIGGYGVVNVAGGNVKLDTISFKNSTLTELSTQLMDVRTAVSSIYIGNSTFCNLKTALTQLLRFDTNRLPLTVQTEANIFAGNNSGAKINSLSFDMATSPLTVSFGGSYRTNDLTINRYDFANVTVFSGSAYDLFVDPDNRNFTVRPESGFGGRGSAGDPRWFD